MQKPASKRKNYPACKKLCTHISIKSLLVLVACFCFFSPSLLAQKQNLDIQILTELMENRREPATAFYQKLSDATDLAGVVLPLSIITAGLVTHQKSTVQKGLYIAESVAVSTFITLGMKYTFKRPRPFKADPLILQASTGGSPSFPSGHTSEAFAAATSLTLAYPKWFVALPAYAWAGTVGYSRMYLGVHYPSDVLAGALVGAGSAWLMYKVNKWLFRKKF
jgi:membrane-associated phospholipid phosphatase